MVATARMRAPANVGWCHTHRSVAQRPKAPGNRWELGSKPLGSRRRTPALWHEYKKVGGANIRPHLVAAAYSPSHHSGLSSPMPWAKCQIASSVATEFHPRASRSTPIHERADSTPSSVMRPSRLADMSPTILLWLRERPVNIFSLMDLDFTADQREFREELRSFLMERLPDDWAGIFQEDDEVLDVSFTVTRAMAERGWLTQLWPREYGGADAPIWRHLVLQEELWADFE